jgi:hypothetical protein
MYFPESEAIVRKHRDLQQVVELVDAQLSEIYSSAPLRPADFSCVLGAEENQVVSVFDLLTKNGVLFDEEMVECRSCQNLMPADAFRQAVEDEDEFECTSCGRVFSPRTVPILVYRMTTRSLQQPRIQPLPPPLPQFEEKQDKAQAVVEDQAGSKREVIPPVEVVLEWSKLVGYKDLRTALGTRSQNTLKKRLVESTEPVAGKIRYQAVPKAHLIQVVVSDLPADLQTRFRRAGK